MPIEPITPENLVQEVSRIPPTPSDTVEKYGHTFKKIAFATGAVVVVAITVSLVAAAIFWGAPVAIPLLAVAATLFIGTGGVAVASKFFKDKIINKLTPPDSIQNLEVRLYTLMGDKYDPELVSRLKSSVNQTQASEVMSVLNDIIKIHKQVNQLPVGSPINKKSIEEVEKNLKTKIDALPPFAKTELTKLMNNMPYSQDGIVLNASPLQENLPFSKLIPLLKELLGEGYSSDDAKLILEGGKGLKYQFEMIKLLESIKNGEEVSGKIALHITHQHDEGKDAEAVLKLFSRLQNKESPILTETESIARQLLGEKFKDSDIALIKKYGGLDRSLKDLIMLMTELKAQKKDLRDVEDVKRILVVTSSLLEKVVPILKENEVETTKYLNLINRIVGINNDKIPIKWDITVKAFLELGVSKLFLLRPGQYSLGLNQKIYTIAPFEKDELNPYTLGMIKGPERIFSKQSHPLFETRNVIVENLPNDVANNLLQDIVDRKIEMVPVTDNENYKTTIKTSAQFNKDLHRENYLINGHLYPIMGREKAESFIYYDLLKMVNFDVEKAYSISTMLTQTNAVDQLAEVTNLARMHFGNDDIVSSGTEALVSVTKIANGYVVDVHRTYKLYHNTSPLRFDLTNPNSELVPLVNVHYKFTLSERDVAEGYMRDGNIVKTLSFIDTEYNLKGLQLWTLLRNKIGEDKIDRINTAEIKAEQIDPLLQILEMIDQNDPTVEIAIKNLLDSAPNKEVIHSIFDALKAAQ